MKKRSRETQESQESQEPKDVRDGPSNKKRRSQSPVRAIEPFSEQQQVAHALGAMADPKYKPVGRDQTPTGDGNQASSSLPTRTQLEKTLQRPEHAIVSQKIDRKLEGFENTKAAFNIDHIDINLLKEVADDPMTNVSVMWNATIIKDYMSSRSESKPGFEELVTKDDALKAINDIEEQAKRMNITALKGEFERLDTAYDRQLIDRAGKNPYRK